MIQEQTLLSLFKDIEYNCISLNIIHNGLLVNSQTIMFVRKYVEKNEILQKKNEHLFHLWDGNSHHCYIDKEILSKYKLSKVIDDFHYIFDYNV